MSSIFKILVFCLLGQFINAGKSVEFIDLFKSLQNEEIKTFFGTHVGHEHRFPRSIARIAKKPQIINPGALARPLGVIKNNLKDSNSVIPNDPKNFFNLKETTKPELKTSSAQSSKEIESSFAAPTAYASNTVTLPSETTKILNHSTTIFDVETTKISSQSTTIFDGDLLNTIVKTGSTTIDEFFGRNVTTQSYEDYLLSNFTTTLAAKRFPKHKNDPYGVLDALETHTFPVMLMIAVLLLGIVITISSCVQMTLGSFMPRRLFPDLPINDKDESQSYAYNNPSFETKF